MERVGLFALFSQLLNYPDESYLENVDLCRRLVESVDAEAGDFMAQFEESLAGLSCEQLQELFVQTFDLNPLCALEVGWQLYGDNYERGNFLVKVQQELRRYGVQGSSELPDHLGRLLLLLERMEEKDRREFATVSVLPGLRKMLAGLEGKQNPCEALLKAIFQFLKVQCQQAVVGASNE